MVQTNTQDNTQDFSFSSNTLTDKISEYTNNYSSFVSDLSGIKNELSAIKTSTCFSTGTCSLNDFDPIKNSINNVSGMIDTIVEQGNNVSQNLLQNNTAINSSLAQINSNYMLNSNVSKKTLDNLNKLNVELEQDVQNKSRMTEINNYYSNMNRYLIDVMRNLAIVIGIMIVFITLSKRGILPENISMLINIIGVLGIIGYVIYIVYDINIRDKFNFNEYIIPFDATAKHLESTDRSGEFTDIRKVLGREFIGEIDKLQGLSGSCFGDNCCEPGTIYDLSRNACIIKCDAGETYSQQVDPTTGKRIGICI